MFSIFKLLATAPAHCVHGFFGLIPWYQYLPDGDFDSSCTIQNFTLLPSGGHTDVVYILLAVIDDLLRIAGMVAVVYVIIGATQFVTSQGNPEQTAKAQTTVINALIGMAIAMIAVVLVGFIGNKLGG
ncbi:MAG: hypothetical protein ACREGB_04335 [Candidatus Saccharimonadales bacterium]